MKKCTFSAVAAAMFSLSLFSCTDKKNESASDYEISDTLITAVTSETTSSAVSGTSVTSSFITSYVSVTDKNGKAVTDTSGNIVTRAVAADRNNQPVTDSKGEYIEITDSSKVTTSAVESVSKTTVSSVTSVSSSAAESVTESVSSSAAETTVTVPEELTYEPGTIKATWLCEGSSNTIYDNGILMYLNFRIKENIPSGDYEITIDSRNGNPSGSYINYTSLEKLRTEFGKGVVSAGKSAEPEEQYGGSDIFTDIGNISGNPGDEISLPVYIQNNPGDIGGFGFVFTYNRSALEYTSFSNGPLLTSLGIPGTISTAEE